MVDQLERMVVAATEMQDLTKARFKSIFGFTDEISITEGHVRLMYPIFNLAVLAWFSTD